MADIRVVAFDGDDTLWRSQDFYDDAQREYESILSRYIDTADRNVLQSLYACESRNIALFGYGVKGMTLSMLEAAIQMTEQRIAVDDIERILEMGKRLLKHPVELLPGIMQAVSDISELVQVVLITKGDLFHQEYKVGVSGLSHLFRRIEILSEKDQKTYVRLFDEFEITPEQFLMIGNSMRSDIAPVLALGGWAVYMPYHTTWEHEVHAEPIIETDRLREVKSADQLIQAVTSILQA